MEYVRLRGEEHQLPMPVKMILYGLEAAQDLMVTVRDLRRGCVTFFPEEAQGWVGGWGPQYHVLNRGRWTREGPGGR